MKHNSLLMNNNFCFVLVYIIIKNRVALLCKVMKGTEFFVSFECCG